LGVVDGFDVANLQPIVYGKEFVDYVKEIHLFVLSSRDISLFSIFPARDNPKKINFPKVTSRRLQSLPL
jgi:hypothetical protein